MRLYQLLLPATVLIVAAVQFVTPGHLGVLVNRPAIADVAEIPPRADHAKLRRFLDAQAIVLPADFPMTPPGEPAPVRLGYNYRTLSLLKLPLLAYRDLGFVLYDDNGMRQRMIPLDDDYMKLLAEEAGEPLGQGYAFPFWRYVWGWLIVAALAAALVSWRHEEAAKRLALGII